MSSMMIGTYIGDNEELKGETALLQWDFPQIMAQFDNWDTGLSHGWYPFASSDWEIDDRGAELT